MEVAADDMQARENIRTRGSQSRGLNHVPPLKSRKKEEVPILPFLLNFPSFFLRIYPLFLIIFHDLFPIFPIY